MLNSKQKKFAVLLTALFLLLSTVIGAAETYQPPRLSAPGSWSMIVVPDVQNYFKFSTFNGIMDLMMSWIRVNQDTLNIQQVMFTGDLIAYNNVGANRANNNVLGLEQWKAFSRVMERLDGYLPYILCTGNHDYGINNAENKHSFFADFFPTDRNLRNRSMLLECAPNRFNFPTLENAAYEFTAPAPDKRKFLVLSLEFAPRVEVLNWAKKLVDQPRFADHIAIVLTHSYMRRNGKRILQERYPLSHAGGQSGEEIWQKLIYPAKNIRLVISGHVGGPNGWGVGFSTDKNHIGKVVNQMVFNTQSVGGGVGIGRPGNGGDGWLRILEFMPDKKTVKATTFSPLFAISPSSQHLAWRHDKINEFTFTIE